MPQGSDLGVKKINQSPHQIKDTNEKVTTSQLDIPDERRELSPFPAGASLLVICDISSRALS